MELHELPSGTTSTSSWGTAMSTTSSSWRRCGNWNSRLKLLHWRSKSNHVQIRFTSDNSYSSSGFQLLATVERSEWLLSPFLTIINLSKLDAVAAESTTLFLHCLPWMKCFWKWLAGLKREPIDPLHSTLRLAKMLSLGRRQNQMKFRQIENQSQIIANHFRWVKKNQKRYWNQLTEKSERDRSQINAGIETEFEFIGRVGNLFYASTALLTLVMEEVLILFGNTGCVLHCWVGQRKPHNVNDMVYPP